MNSITQEMDMVQREEEAASDRWDSEVARLRGLFCEGYLDEEWDEFLAGYPDSGASTLLRMMAEAKTPGDVAKNLDLFYRVEWAHLETMRDEFLERMAEDRL